MSEIVSFFLIRVFIVFETVLIYYSFDVSSVTSMMSLITSANKAEVMLPFYVFVCVSYCEQDY